MSSPRTMLRLCALVLAGSVSGAALAQLEPVRIRGSIESYRGELLSVRRADDTTARIWVRRATRIYAEPTAAEAAPTRPGDSAGAAPAADAAARTVIRSELPPGSTVVVGPALGRQPLSAPSGDPKLLTPGARVDVRARREPDRSLVATQIFVAPPPADAPAK